MRNCREKLKRAENTIHMSPKNGLGQKTRFFNYAKWLKKTRKAGKNEES
jgi:hypothetical protein